MHKRRACAGLSPERVISDGSAIFFRRRAVEELAQKYPLVARRRTVRKPAEDTIAKLLVKALRLEGKGGEPGADTAALPRDPLRLAHQRRAKALAMQGVGHGQEFDEQPVIAG